MGSMQLIGDRFPRRPLHPPFAFGDRHWSAPGMDHPRTWIFRRSLGVILARTIRTAVMLVVVMVLSLLLMVTKMIVDICDTMIL